MPPWTSPEYSPVPSPFPSFRCAMVDVHESTAWSLPGIATLDFGRAARRGYPEAIYCAGKTPEQVAAIAAAIREQPAVTLFTRANPDHAAAIKAVLPGARHDAAAWSGFALV